MAAVRLDGRSIGGTRPPTDLRIVLVGVAQPDAEHRLDGLVVELERVAEHQHVDRPVHFQAGPELDARSEAGLEEPERLAIVVVEAESYGDWHREAHRAALQGD